MTPTGTGPTRLSPRTGHAQRQQPARRPNLRNPKTADARLLRAAASPDVSTEPRSTRSPDRHRDGLRNAAIPNGAAYSPLGAARKAERAGTRLSATDGGHVPVEATKWFLDVDGTLSPYGLTEAWTGPTLYRAQPDSDLAVPYRKEVVDMIQRLHTRGLVSVTWLTTWDADELSAWVEVGLGPFPAITRYRAPDNRWWKAHAVQDWMRKHPNSSVIWTDDDISHGGLRGLDRTRLFAIAPDHTVGLTDQDLTRIEAWAYANRSRRERAGRDRKRRG